MTIHTILFNLFASLAIATGIGVIISKNPVHSVVFLILVFCNATGLLLLFKIELLAMMFIIIYVGAIAVLFLFVVMMLNIKMNEVGTDTNSSSTMDTETAAYAYTNAEKGTGLLRRKDSYYNINKLKLLQTPFFVVSISTIIITTGLIMT